MKLHIKIVLTTIVTLLLLIYLAGFMPIFSQSPPDWVITGRIMAPSPETTASWIPVANAILTLTDIEGNIHMVATGKDGSYYFSNLAVDANSVITAIAIVNGKTMVFKDVIPEAVAAPETYDAKTADAESTALALIVEELTKQGLTYENIDLEIIQDSDNFEIVEEQVLSVLEDNGNVMDDIIVAGEEVVSGEASDDAPDIEATDEEGKLYKVTVTLREKISDVDPSADTAATYTITASFFGSGTIEPSGAVTVNHGLSQTFTITPNPNYHIDGVLVDGKLVFLKEDGIYNFTDVTANHIIYASFAINTYTLTMNTDADGTGSGSVIPTVGVYTYNYGDEVTISATADATSSVFDGWSGDAFGTSDEILTMTENKDVTASFTLKTYTLTAKTGGTGAGTVTIDPVMENYDHGDEVTVSATADAISSDFTGWAGYDSDDLIENDDGTYSITMDSDKSVTATFTLKKVTLTVAVTGTGSGKVSPTVGVYTCDYGDEVTIGAKPDTGSIGTWISKKTDVGSIFTGWSGDASGTSDVTLVMDSDKSVTATFTKKKTLTLTVAVTGTGSGTVSPAVGVHTYNYGDEITIGATPDTALATWVSDKADLGSIFTGWSGDALGTGDMTLIMDSDKSIIATFTLTEVTLTVAITGTGSGTVSPAVGVHTYNYGETVIITATADASSNFTGRSGDASGTVDMTLTMDSDKSVTSVFNLKTYTITASTVSNGSFSPSGSVTVEHGSSKSFSITPNTNYNIEDVKVDGSSVGAVASYTFTDVTVDHTIAASFNPAAVSFAVTTENLGTETAGTAFSVTITAKDNEGNTATGYTGSHNIIWSWNATNSPDGTAPTKPADGNQTFEAGAVTVEEFTLYNSGDTPTITATIGGVSGTSSTFTVNSGALASFTFDAIADQTAGDGFSVTLSSAKDAYGNPVAGTYNIAWSSNASNSPLPSNTPPTKPDDGSQIFSALGAVTVTRFTLTNASDTIITATISGVSTTAPVTVTAGDSSYVKIEDAVGGAGNEVTTRNMTAGETFTVYAVGYDAYGNYVSNETVSWTGTDVCSDRLDPITGSSTTFTARTAGTATITADHATVTDATTGTIMVSPKTVDYFKVSGDASMTAGDPNSITITAYDQYDNVATGYSGNKILTFSGAISSPNATSPTCAETNFGTATTVTFIDGVGSSNMKLYKAETAHIKAAVRGITTSDTHDLDVSVTTGTLASFTFAPIGTPQEKDKLFYITIYAKDASENTLTNYTGKGTLTLIVSGGGPIGSGTPPKYLNKVVIEIYNKDGTTVDFSDVDYVVDDKWSRQVVIGATSADFLGFEKNSEDALKAFVYIKITYDDDTTVTGVSDSFIVE